jgi:hypothetical protein
VNVPALGTIGITILTLGMGLGAIYVGGGKIVGGFESSSWNGD